MKLYVTKGPVKEFLFFKLSISLKNSLKKLKSHHLRK
jgi:hypothetical protein